MWADAGIDVELVPVPQDQLIFRALTGDFDVLFWRNHAGFDPLLQYHWWHSTTASDPPDLSVNFSRIRDPIIDENLDILRRSADPDERRAAAEAINRRFGEQVYDIWLTWPVWAIVHDPLTISGPWVEVSDRPGLGVTVDWPRARQHCLHT